MKSIERNKKNRIAAAITAALVPMASAIVAPGVAAQEVNDAEKAVAEQLFRDYADYFCGSELKDNTSPAQLLSFNGISR